jgi:hypothetical protein
MREDGKIDNELQRRLDTIEHKINAIGLLINFAMSMGVFLWVWLGTNWEPVYKYICYGALLASFWLAVFPPAQVLIAIKEAPGLSADGESGKPLISRSAALPEGLRHIRRFLLG